MVTGAAGFFFFDSRASKGRLNKKNKPDRRCLCAWACVCVPQLLSLCFAQLSRSVIPVCLHPGIPLPNPSPHSLGLIQTTLIAGCGKSNSIHPSPFCSHSTLNPSVTSALSFLASLSIRSISYPFADYAILTHSATRLFFLGISFRDIGRRYSFLASFLLIIVFVYFSCFPLLAYILQTYFPALEYNWIADNFGPKSPSATLKKNNLESKVFLIILGISSPGSIPLVVTKAGSNSRRAK